MKVIYATTVPHPPHVPEGSRQHVIWWSTAGRHCSTPNCEINDADNRRRERGYDRWIDSLERDPMGDA